MFYIHILFSLLLASLAPKKKILWFPRRNIFSAKMGGGGNIYRCPMKTLQTRRWETYNTFLPARDLCCKSTDPAPPLIRDKKYKQIGYVNQIIRQYNALSQRICKSTTVQLLLRHCIAFIVRLLTYKLNTMITLHPFIRIILRICRT